MTARAFLRVLVALLVLLPSAGGLAEPEARVLKQADAELRRLVNDAIDRGADWLAEAQHVDGSFASAYTAGYPIGGTALGALALLHSGCDRDGIVIQKAFACLRSSFERERFPLKTYSVSVLVMALAEYGRRRGNPGEDDERYGGAAGGGFHLDEPDLEWMQKLVNWLVNNQQSNGAWRYPEHGFDHSNSQYALLALKEARRCGLEVPDRTFERALKHFLSAQDSNGPQVPRYEESGGDGVYGATREAVPGRDRARGWGYIAPSPCTGSMTTAGVAAVAICAGELGELGGRSLEARAEQSIRDGLAWLGRHFSVRGNPGGSPSWHYYYLYGLERAGVLAGRIFMGEHRWYAEGARYLVNAQRPDGAWPHGQAWGNNRPGGPGDAIYQSFALLFLTRATARGLGVATEDPLLDLTEGHKLDDRAHADLFTAALAELDAMPAERRADRARDFAFLGPRILPKLLIHLADEDPTIRRRAVLLLRGATGLTFGFDPEGPAEERERAAASWTRWYLANRKTLALDPASARIR